MMFRKLSQLFLGTALALTFVAFASVAGGSEVKAQGYYRRYDPYHRGFAEREAIRRREAERIRREEFRRHERLEHRYYRPYPYRHW